MKIALTGAHGVGKTTLLIRLKHELAKRGTVEICREVPRLIIDAVCDSEFFRRANNTPLRQLIILLHQVVEEHVRAQDVMTILSDRTVIDHLAYTMTLFPDIETTPEYLAISTAIRSWLPEYNLIFKLPIEFPVIDDGIREADIAFQRQIDSSIDKLYSEFGLAPIIIRGPIEERLASALAAIEAATFKSNESTA